MSSKKYIYILSSDETSMLWKCPAIAKHITVDTRIPTYETISFKQYAKTYNDVRNTIIRIVLKNEGKKDFFGALLLEVLILRTRSVPRWTKVVRFGVMTNETSSD
jgi:hypothetical protein